LGALKLGVSRFLARDFGLTVIFKHENIGTLVGTKATTDAEILINVDFCHLQITHLSLSFIVDYTPLPDTIKGKPTLSVQNKNA
jgi:hypothetical protein